MGNKTFPDLSRVEGENAPFFEPEPGLARRILAHNANMMLVEHRMNSGWAGPREIRRSSKSAREGRQENGRFLCARTQNA